MLSEGYSYHPEGYLWRVLPVEKFTALPETVEVENHQFTKKNEFHVTVINARGFARQIGGEDSKKIEEIELNIQRLLKEYVSNNPIEFVHFNDDIRLATYLDRQSLAARCTVTNLEGFFEIMRSVYGKDIPTQATHVSIYTATGAAVGIDSVEQMESFKKVEIPEVQEVLNSIEK